MKARLKFRGDLWVVLALGAVALTAIVASFSTLVGLAHYVGWHGKSGWLLPVCIDALAFGAGRVWLKVSVSEEARDFARKVSLTAIGLSVVGNAVGHLVTMGSTSPVKVGLAIIVGAIPPAALAAVGHLFSMLETAAVKAEVVAEHAVHVAKPAHVAQSKSRRRGRPAKKTQVARTYWESERAQGRTPTGAELARIADADPTMGCKWVRQFTSEEMKGPVASLTLVNA